MKFFNIIIYIKKKMEKIRIGFSGNRFGLSENQKNDIIKILDLYDDIVVSHGDCVGADTQFHNICLKYKENNKDKKITITIFPPNNPSLRAFNKADILMEEDDYLKRNLKILKNSDILIACPIDKNKEELRSGTWSTIRQAKKINIFTYIF
jgi:hypothetical protein